MSFFEAKKVLICLRYGIGDLVMQLPALSALREELAEAHITGIGSRPAIELLEGDERVDELVSVHDFGLAHWGDFGNSETRSAIHAWLRARNFDVVIDPSHATMGFGSVVWDSTSAILDTGNGLEDRALEKGGKGLDAIREAVHLGWGIEVPDDRRPELPLRKEERDHARRLLAQFGMSGPARPYAVSPVASSPLKRWPVSSVAAVARELLMEHEDARILILSGDQQELGRSLEQGIGYSDRTAVLPPANLRLTGALIARCRALLCNDTGLMHLAAAVGTPTVAVFGPTNPAIYAPPGAVGLGAQVSCPHRLERRFGPPRCVVEARCLIDRNGCIDTVPVQRVCDTLNRVTC
ncbi:glycosyltransferase family 9 protein [Thiohalomonas denitrificans]|uniref:Heptosyltransferase-2 n=1 Tax=Thiohalomonas denitrificans TaxID=415747 RepID=A0A1G5QF28_9GAMM|nr:glycosyltransferase family 9 protein [Thiohalomonas denitrificans]SCZ60297.1 heptosyltransferase-2 [Thiohalomonas denitrificans]